MWTLLPSVAKPRLVFPLILAELLAFSGALPTEDDDEVRGFGLGFVETETGDSVKFASADVLYASVRDWNQLSCSLSCGLCFLGWSLTLDKSLD